MGRWWIKISYVFELWRPVTNMVWMILEATRCQHKNLTGLTKMQTKKSFASESFGQDLQDIKIPLYTVEWINIRRKRRVPAKQEQIRTVSVLGTTGPMNFVFCRLWLFKPAPPATTAVFGFGSYMSSLYSLLSPVRACLSRYVWLEGFVGAKKKTDLGLFPFNPLWLDRISVAAITSALLAS